MAGPSAQAMVPTELEQAQASLAQSNAEVQAQRARIAALEAAAASAGGGAAESRPNRTAETASTSAALGTPKSLLINSTKTEKLTSKNLGKQITPWSRFVMAESAANMADKYFTTHPDTWSAEERAEWSQPTLTFVARHVDTTLFDEYDTFSSGYDLYQAAMDIGSAEAKVQAQDNVSKMGVIRMRDGESVDDYLDRCTEIHDQLKRAEHSLDRVTFFLFLLTGLPMEYMSWVTVMRTEWVYDEKKLMRHYRMALRGHEVQMQRAKGKSARTPQATAATLQVGNGGVDTCHYCGHAGHFRRDCRKLKTDVAAGNYVPPAAAARGRGRGRGAGRGRGGGGRGRGRQPHPQPPVANVAQVDNDRRMVTLSLAASAIHKSQSGARGTVPDSDSDSIAGRSTLAGHPAAASGAAPMADAHPTPAPAAGAPPPPGDGSGSFRGGVLEYEMLDKQRELLPIYADQRDSVLGDLSRDSSSSSSSRGSHQHSHGILSVAVTNREVLCLDLLCSCRSPEEVLSDVVSNRVLTQRPPFQGEAPPLGAEPSTSDMWLSLSSAPRSALDLLAEADRAECVRRQHARATRALTSRRWDKPSDINREVAISNMVLVGLIPPDPAARHHPPSPDSVGALPEVWRLGLADSVGDAAQSTQPDH